MACEQVLELTSKVCAGVAWAGTAICSVVITSAEGSCSTSGGRMGPCGSAELVDGPADGPVCERGRLCDDEGSLA